MAEVKISELVEHLVPADDDLLEVSRDDGGGNYTSMHIKKGNLITDSDVNGPVISVDGNIAVFSGVTGKIIRDSGFPTSTTYVHTMELIATKVETDVASIFQDLDAAKYDTYWWNVRLLRPATNNVNLNLRSSNAIGGPGDSVATDYEYQRTMFTTVAVPVQVIGSALEMISGQTNATGNVADINIYIDNASTGQFTAFQWTSGYLDDAPTPIQTTLQGTGKRNEQAAVNYLELFYTSGNIQRAEHSLYGFRKAP